VFIILTIGAILLSLAPCFAAEPAQKTESAEDVLAKLSSYSPAIPGAEVKALLAALAHESPELQTRLVAVLDQKNYRLNDQLLGMLAQIYFQAPGAQRKASKAEELARKELLKEFEVQLFLQQKEVDKAQLKKALADIFAIKQERNKLRLVELESEVDQFKKTIADRDKNKNAIIDRKLGTLLDSDPLAW